MQVLGALRVDEYRYSIAFDPMVIRLRVIKLHAVLLTGTASIFDKDA
jgi:hypothetical protein